MTSKSRDWVERFDDVKQQARQLETPEDRVEKYEDALELASLWGMPEQQVLEVWEEVIEEGLARPFFERTFCLIRDTKVWTDIATYLEAAEADWELRAKVVLFGLGNIDRAEQMVEGIDDETVSEKAEQARQARADWRKFQHSVRRDSEQDSGEKQRQFYLQLADVAFILDERGREIDLLRRLIRENGNSGARLRLRLLYRAEQKWPMYVDLLKDEIQQTQDRRGKLDRLYELVRVYRDEMSHQMMVIETYKQILEIDSENLAAIDALIERYREMGRASDLVDMLEKKADLVEAQDEKVAVLEEVAELHAHKFHNHPEAIKAYEGILDADPEHPRALDYLQEMYKKRRRWDDLIRVSRQQAAAVEDEDERISILEPVAQLVERREPDQSIELWEAIRDVRPEHGKALSALQKLYQDRERYSDLVEVLERRIELTDDPEARSQLYQKLGFVYVEQLDDAERAKKMWKKALETDPNNSRVRRHLEQLFVELRQWDQLESFFRESQGPEAFAKKLERIAGSLSEPSLQADLFERAAEVWEDELDDANRAQHLLRQALDTDDSREELALKLEQMYLESRAYRKLRDVYKTLIERADGWEQKREYTVKLADLYREQLDKPRQAFQWYAKVVRQKPDSDDIWAILKQLAAEHDQYEALAELYVSIAKDPDTDPARQPVFRTEAGRILVEQLEKPNEAADVIAPVIEEGRISGELLAVREQICRAKQQWSQLEQVLEARVERSGSEDQKLDGLLELGELAEDKLEEPSKAVGYYERALDHDPSNWRALSRLRQLYSETGNVKSLRNTLKQLLELERASEQPEDETVFELSLELGDLLGREFSSNEQAVEAFSEALTIAPESSRAREQLQQYLDSDDEAIRGRAAHGLAESAKTLEDWPRYVELLQTVADTHSDSETRLRASNEMADVYRTQLDRYEEAFGAYGHVLREQPDRADVREGLVDAVSTGEIDWTLLTELYEEILDGLDDKALRRDYLFELGKIYADRLEAGEEATGYFAEALSVDPDFEPAVDRLIDLYRQREDWAELVEMLENKLAFLDGEADEQTRLEMARIARDKLDDPDSAIEYLDKKGPPESVSDEVLEYLAQLYRDCEAWNKLADNLEQRLQRREGDQKLELTARLAEVLGLKLDQTERGIELFKKVLDAEPANEIAQKGLESILAQGGEAVESLGEYLEQLYRQNQAWNALIRIQDIQIQSEQNPAQRAERYRQMADVVRDEFEDEEGYFQYLAKAFVEDPVSQDCREQLRSLAEDQGKKRHLAEYIEQAAANEVAPDQLKVELYWEATDLFLDNGMAERAEKVLQSILDLDPENSRAVERLEGIYKSLQDWDGLVDILEQKLSMVDGDDVTEVLFELGNVYEKRLDDPEAATEAYERLVERSHNDAAFDRLEDLYQKLEAWEKQRDLLTTRLELAETRSERKQYMYRLGELEAEKLQEPNRAIEHYENILSASPDADEAIERLRELYRETRQWESLVQLLEHQVADASGEKVQQLKLEKAKVLQDKLDDPETAFDLYAETLDSNPHDESIQAAIREYAERPEFVDRVVELLAPIYKSMEKFGDMVELYRRQLASTSDGDAVVDIYRRIAELYRFELDQPGEAFDVICEALEQYPSAVGLREQFDDLALDSERVGEAIAFYEDLLDSVEQFETRVDLLFRMAELQRLGHPDEPAPVESYEKVLDESPRHVGALKALENIYQSRANWEKLTDILKRRIEAADGIDEEDDVRMRLASLYSAGLDRPDEAVELYTEVLERRPDFDDALEALEQMFVEGTGRQRAEDFLADYYLGDGDVDSFVKLLEQRIQQSRDRDERSRLWRRIGSVYEDAASDLERAMEAYIEAWSEKPKNKSLREQITEIAAQTDRWDALEEAYEYVLDQSMPDELRAELYREIGDIRWTQRQDIESAEEAFLRALEVEPDNLDTLEALGEIYESTEQWEDLSNILRREIEQRETPEKVTELYQKLGAVESEKLQRPDEAIQAFQQVLSFQPDREDAFDALSRLYEQGQYHEKLYELLEQKKSSIEDPDRKAKLAAKMGRLAESELEKMDAALEHWNEVHRIESDDLEALENLRRLYVERDDWESLAPILESEIECRDGDQLDLREMLGTVYWDKLKRADDAVRVWRGILDIDPDRRDALQNLCAIFRETGEASKLAEMLQRLVNHPETPEDEAHELYREMAQLYGNALGETQRAVECWQKVVEHDPEDAEALARLEEYYLSREQWENAIGVLEQKTTLEDSEDDKIALLSRIADIWRNRLERPEEAARAYERILDIAPDHLEASYTLESVYQQMGEDVSAQDLIEVYLNRAEALDESDEDRIESLIQAANQFERLDEYERALITLLSALSPQTIERDQLRDHIEKLARETGLYDELADRLEGLVDRADGGSGEAAAHGWLADIYADELGAFDDAIGHLEALTRTEPKNEERIEQLEGLYEQQGDWDELADLLNRHLETVDEVERKRELTLRLGEVYEDELGDLDSAVETYREVLDMDEGDPEALSALERIHLERDQWDELADLLERKARATYDPEEIVDVRHRLGRLCEDRLEDIDRAAAAYRQALQVDQTHKPSLEALQRIFENRDEHESLIEVYEKELAAEVDPARQLELYKQIASIQEQHLDDPTSAKETYKDALMVDEQDLETIQALERLYLEQEDWHPLVDILERHIRLEDDSASKVDLLNTLGDLQREHIGDLEASLSAYERSLELDPSQETILVRVVSLYETTEQWEAAVEKYKQQFEFADDDKERAEIHRMIGVALREQLGELEQARDHFEQALELSFDEKAAFEALVQLYTELGQIDDLLALYKEAAGRAEDPATEARHLTKIADIYLEEYDDQMSAYSYYEDALELDPGVIRSAGPPLIDMYMSEKQWERVVPMQEKLVEKLEVGSDVSDDRLVDEYIRLAEIYDHLDETAEAIEMYREAYELDGDDSKVLLGLSRLLPRREEWKKALAIHERLERDFLGDLSSEQMANLFFRLGTAHAELGNPDEAERYFRRVLEVEGSHKDALEQLVSIESELGNWDSAVEYKRRLVDIEDEDVEKFRLLNEIGDAVSEKLEDLTRAIRIYREALELKPDSVAVLHKLLRLYRANEQWIEAVEIIEELIEREDSAERRSKYYRTIGVLFRDEIEDPESALEYFEKALDEDPTHLEAFEAIDRIMTRQKRWPELEKAYRRMLERVTDLEGDHDNIRIKLWENLGEIYRSRLGNFERAIEAYETIADIHPDDKKIRLILTELYDRTEAGTDNIVEHHRALLEEEPFRIESYRTLFETFESRGEIDKAWCMTAALEFLGKANDRESGVYRGHRPEKLARARETLDRESLKLIYHDRIGGTISFVMNVLGQGLRSFYSQQLSQWNVDPEKDKIPLDAELHFAEVYRYGAEVMNIVPPPDLYLNRDRALGIKNANTPNPSIIVGGDVVQGKSDMELAFMIGHQLCWMRPEHYLGSVGYPTEFLKVLFLGVMHITDPSLEIDKRLGDRGERIIDEISKLPNQMLSQLQKRMKRYLAREKNPNLTRWKKYVEHTANRVGLLLVGDINEAVYAMKNDVEAIGKASLKEKIRELVLFSISEEYFQLREQLGLTVEGA